MIGAVNTYRGSLVECSHNVHIAVVDSNNKLLKYYSNPEKIIYARSSVKPIQVIQVLESGACENYNISDKEIALMCSSHSSEDYHVEGINSILKKSNLSEDNLKCGTKVPFNLDVYKNLIRSGKDITKKHHSCSGKHCGMLISAKANKENLDDYLELKHPVQQRILNNMSKICGCDKKDILIGIDGCGAPTHALKLKNLAYGFAQMANPTNIYVKSEYINRITKAMISYPEMVGGSDRFCTELMKACKGRIFGKMGSEGVYLLGDKKNGIGIAVKTEDGSDISTNCAVVETLDQLGLISKEEKEKLSKFHNPKLKNARGKIIGETKSEFKLR
ncbi:asparaginase [Romboutsia sp. 1001285H_161024_C4]|uniref:asparaginase n=1 Tax=Romboutsia sp. 1001285H_161024_C4 TaxID=2787109 RepID=UPI001A9BDC6C